MSWRPNYELGLERLTSFRTSVAIVLGQKRIYCESAAQPVGNALLNASIHVLILA